MPGGEVLGGDRLSVDIEARHLGGRQVLGRMAFEAVPGEVLALLAPSGTGKTTALRIVSGLDRHFTGTVARPAGAVGMMFQEPRLLPWMDVAANIRLVAPNLVGRDLDLLLEQVGLPDVLAARPASLSLGMARRVALARALAARPALLVLDEPFASLDPQLGSALATFTGERARRSGAVMLMATHDLAQALGCADRVLILAGSPAFLVADIACPGDGTPSRMVEELQQRFPFLGSHGNRNAIPPPEVQARDTLGETFP